MIEKPIKRLNYLCEIIPSLLTEISEKDFSFKRAPGKWSKKEILGHLIDSATNNHQRFVRSQFENVPHISYDQNKWNENSHYNRINCKHLIAFWEIYNLHLIRLIKEIPEAGLKRECTADGQNNVTIEWLFNDYVKHQEHHLKQITDYK